MKKGELIYILVEEANLEDINLKGIQNKKVTKDGKYICKTDCQWKYPRLGSYYPCNKCQCITENNEIKECNKSNCS